MRGLRSAPQPAESATAVAPRIPSSLSPGIGGVIGFEVTDLRPSLLTLTQPGRSSEATPTGSWVLDQAKLLPSPVVVRVAWIRREREYSVESEEGMKRLCYSYDLAVPAPLQRDPIAVACLQCPYHDTDICSYLYRLAGFLLPERIFFMWTARGASAGQVSRLVSRVYHLLSSGSCMFDFTLNLTSREVKDGKKRYVVPQIVEYLDPLHEEEVNEAYQIVAANLQRAIDRETAELKARELEPQAKKGF